MVQRRARPSTSVASGPAETRTLRSSPLLRFLRIVLEEGGTSAWSRRRRVKELERATVEHEEGKGDGEGGRRRLGTSIGRGSAPRKKSEEGRGEISGDRRAQSLGKQTY